MPAHARRGSSSFLKLSIDLNVDFPVSSYGHPHKQEGPMKKIDLTLTTILASALLLAGCSDSDSDGWTADRDTAVCVDQSTNRVPDSNCEPNATGASGGHFAWYYMGRSSTIPPYGETPFGGSFTLTDGATYFHAPVETAVTRATAISRGGFGESAHGFGGEGGFGE